MTIAGLTYRQDYIDPAHAAALLHFIDAQPWRGDLTRRTQHYGYVYDYRARRVDPSMYIGPLPTLLQTLSAQLHADKLLPLPPDQAIINEYLPGQGIADHIDCAPCFGAVVASLTLGSAVVMDFKQAGKHEQLLLEPQSLLVLAGSARYDWTHGIAKRKRDTYAGQVFQRSRRVSVTFRTVTLEA